MRGETGFVTIGDAEIEIERRGSGQPLLLLPSEDMLEGEALFVDTLARAFEVIIPAPPGFGASNRPDWITAPDDIAYLYLSLLDRLALEAVTVIGCSLGGWIAAELATKNDTRLSRLVLVDPYGIKPGGPSERDIADIWQLSPQRVAALKWREPPKAALDTAAESDAALAQKARNLESFARFCWEPYMHNPKLAHRLGRIGVPTLMVWGEDDGIVAPAYGEAYRALIPGATLRVIPAAGHYPHLERPDAFLAAIGKFLGTPQLAAGTGDAA
ncbi:MAG TPA: alpha/beta hydrolase [Stellaceae bacterium]|nr:alpha/beta hydrolase [Stellaceae bacterium]